MVKKHVRIYVEGGAEGKTADTDFRRGWKRFLTELHDLARGNGYHSLEIVRGKGRSEAFRRFTKYFVKYPNDLCVLLADSETAVASGQKVWDVVGKRIGDKWVKPEWATERHLYLMAHMVETWLLTDVEALEGFFKKGFLAAKIPTTRLEERSKKDVENALREATRDSSRGAYRHGQAHEIIEFVNPKHVRTLRHGNRLFDTLSKVIIGEK